MIPHFHSKKNWGLQRLINLYKAAQVMNDLAGIQILVPMTKLYSHEWPMIVANFESLPKWVYSLAGETFSEEKFKLWVE